MIKTNTASPIEIHKMVSPKLNVNRPVSYAAVLGPQNIIYKKFQSQSWSNSQANINCVFNSQSLIDVATAAIGVEFEITFTGTSAGVGIPLIQMKGANTSVGVSAGTLNRDAPRAYPLAQILTALNIQVENDTPSTNVNQYFNCISRYYNDKESQDLYQCPSMLDIVQNYEDLPDFSAVDPLNDWINNSTQRTRGGGGVSNLQIMRNDSTGLAGDTAVVRFTSFEPIYLSPFLYGANKKQQRQAKPLTGLNTLIVNMTFGAQNNLAYANALSRIWSHNPSTVGGSSTFSNVSVDIKDVFMNMSYYQAPLTYPIRSGLGNSGGYSYPYVEYLLLPTLLSTPVASGATVNIQMNTTKVSAVPGKLFIWVSRDPSTQNFTTTDTAFAIVDSGISITFNGQDGILSSCTAQQLYDMSKINGLVDNFSDFSSNVGSFLCLKFGQDINLGPNLSPGVQGNFDLSMSVTMRNVNKTQSLKPQLNVLVQYEGTYSVVGTQWSRSIGPITQNDMLTLQESEHGFVTYNPSEMLNGGSIFSSIGNFFKKPFVQSIARTAWGALSPQTYAAANRACEGNNSGVCKFVKGSALMDGSAMMDGDGEGVFLGGRCPKGERKNKKSGKCVSYEKEEKKSNKKENKKGKCNNPVSKMSTKQRKEYMDCVRSFRKPKEEKKKGKGAGLLSYDDLRKLMQ